MQARDKLLDLGFGEAEADLYLFLLRESPATGYRIAQAIGRPASQTYKAIESLSRKGAVMIDDGKTKLCRAVAAQEFLGHVERSFREKIAGAAESLRELPRPGPDDRIYQIESKQEVLERAAAMLSHCRKVALLDAFPTPLQLLRPQIESAHRRGVRIALKIYQPDRARVTLKVLLMHGPDVIDIWPGEVLNLVTDGKEFLSALFSPGCDDVRNAIWSSNRFLAARQHNGLSCETCLTYLLSFDKQGTPPKSWKNILKKMEMFYFRNSPGFQSLPYRRSNKK